MSIARLRLLFLLLLASFALVACDMTASTEEDNNFDGPPIVRIAAPLAGDTYREGVGVDILVRVENAGLDIARVAIRVDNEIVGEMRHFPMKADKLVSLYKLVGQLWALVHTQLVLMLRVGMAASVRLAVC